MPRLGYTKSRNGCLRCRQRRVKVWLFHPCDEKRPCSACVRHDVRCSLLDNPPPAGGPSRRELPAKPTSAQTAFPYFDKFMLPTGGEREAAWIQDLELMHHYSVVTSHTMPRAQDELHVWQKLAPNLSFKYPFIIHQILAVAAFHMAYLEPERRSELLLLASQHQNRSIEGMRAHLANITTENCHALFMASSLLLVGAFASFANIRSSDSPPQVVVGQRTPTIEDMIDVFILDRGVASVLHSSEPTIHSGYFRDLFHFKAHKRVNPFMEQMVKELRALEDQINQDESISRIVRILVNLEITKLLDAAEKAVRTTKDSEMRVATYWPITIAEDYITLLRQRNEVALLVLVHYCCILYKAEENNWFLKGWGISIASDADKLISPKWRGAIKWPLEQLAQNVAPTS
ncbi:hypothetical protein M406DRAFT_42085 [Cryphonectria parasitica EP155]|uniref:Zn(2)-C6 fungal-type domain-containing protein n=1 Tax=Cryphonectria parasitica (strain ATCC 38755 / EP155) TaxID=660469 RepID=A0A9P4Y0Y7_CRYP1|nr:uncharacterized protein M406DRAFT_42085 [Cryphonectria parasitica EP155]KAF3764130.1 hypothetical protein M406DRAFT_42085 [Cryphonectria parasitica EP155]